MITAERDLFRDASRVITVAVFVAALGACLAAPFLAVTWTRAPFLGFLFEPTLVVNGTGDATWPGRQAGVDYPQQLQRIDDVWVATNADVASVLATRPVGQRVSVLARLPDGSRRLFPSVTLIAFPAAAMLRSFWLPYMVGAIYLAIGAWMYRMRGGTRPGRVFAFFCFCVTLVCVLLFDLETTHAGASFWTAAIAMIGGALISMAMRFPEESWLVRRWPWLLAVPYTLSVGLAAWGAVALQDPSHPWAYIEAWGYSYRYAALGVVIFLGMTCYRAATSTTPAVRQQARIVLLGGILAFVPVTIWLVAPLFAVPMSFDAALFVPSLLVFPVAVAIAIFRYRLLEVEVIINRTIFYGAITGLLAGIFSALIALVQRVFISLTGQKSDAAVILTTLLLVAVVDLIRKPAQRLVDSQFKEAPDTMRELKQFGNEARAALRLTDETHMARRLLDEAARSLHAQSGAISLAFNGKAHTIHTYGRWRGDARLCVALECNRERLGLLSLGPRANWEAYTRQECEALSRIAQDVARSIRLARALTSLPSPGAQVHGQATPTPASAVGAPPSAPSCAPRA